MRIETRSLFSTGKHQDASEQIKGKMVYFRQRSDQIFRVLDLPVSVDPNEVKATLSDGVLEVTLSMAALAEEIPVLIRFAFLAISTLFGIGNGGRLPFGDYGIASRMMS